MEEPGLNQVLLVILHFSFSFFFLLDMKCMWVHVVMYFIFS